MTEKKSSNKGKKGTKRGGRGDGKQGKDEQSKSQPAWGDGNRRNRGGKQSSSSGSSNGNANSKNNRQTTTARQSKSFNNSQSIEYPTYLTLEDCLIRYNAKDPNLIRGTMRALPVRDGPAFCTCDRGSQVKDVVLDGPLERNRALDGDTVFVELLPHNQEEESQKFQNNTISKANRSTPEKVTTNNEAEEETKEEWWQDDALQVSLWDPVVPIAHKKLIPKNESSSSSDVGLDRDQRHGRVVHVVHPKE